MRGRPKMVGRLAQVRLTDIDPAIRRRAATKAVAERMDEVASGEDRLLAFLAGANPAAVDPVEVDALQRAAENPSDRVYWVPEAAVRKVLGA